MTDIQKAKRDRSDAFDEQDIPDVTESNEAMQADLLENAPDYFKRLLAVG